MLPHNRIDFHMQTRLTECMRNTECWSLHPRTYKYSQLLLKARDSLKHISGNTVTLQCISYHYHARVQQREVQVMDIWIAGVILWHLCMGQTRLTRTLQLKQTPLNQCLTVPDSTWAASSTANSPAQLLTQISFSHAHAHGFCRGAPSSSPLNTAVRAQTHTGI